MWSDWWTTCSTCRGLPAAKSNCDASTSISRTSSPKPSRWRARQSKSGGIHSHVACRAVWRPTAIRRGWRRCSAICSPTRPNTRTPAAPSACLPRERMTRSWCASPIRGVASPPRCCRTSSTCSSRSGRTRTVLKGGLASGWRSSAAWSRRTAARSPRRAPGRGQARRSRSGCRRRRKSGGTRDRSRGAVHRRTGRVPCAGGG